MPRPPLFTLVFGKFARAKGEMARLDASLGAHERIGSKDAWTRTATIAFAVHGAYTGLENIMADIANQVDDAVPRGANSHQALLDQMRVAIDGRRPPLLDDSLFVQLLELKSFRHLVRHQYGIDLDPEKTEAKRQLMHDALAAFGIALGRLETALTDQ